MTDDRTFQFGEPVGDPRYYPMGPVFIRQPNNTVFNVGRRKIINDVSLLCVARGKMFTLLFHRWNKGVFLNVKFTDFQITNIVDLF